MENDENNSTCELCRKYGIEKGDTLYQVAYPDTGIDFYAIRNIKYYWKTVRGKLYIMTECEYMGEIERYEVTPTVKELLGI